MSHIYALHDYDENLKKRGCFAIDHCKAKEYNDRGYGIFFSVNSFIDGVRREENLKKLNAWFIDIDEGSKPDQFKKIMEFRTRPSMIVETKNGHHVYWGCKEQPTIEDYNNTLERLVKYFNADKNAKGVTRILRLPKYKHLKNKNAPFVIKELYKKETYYTTEQMHEFLPVIEKPTPRPVGDVPAGEFWDKANKLDVRKAFTTLSGTSAVNNDTLETEGRNIIVNGQKLKSCWIDKDEKIGSHSNGGPTIVNWIDWYYNDMSKTAEILEEYFPEIKDKVVDFQFVEKIEQLEKVDYKKHKLPKLRGLMALMFDHIYQTSPVQRAQFAFASSIMTMSTLLGNKIQYNRTLPNLYSAIIAPSGFGKDAPLRFPVDLLNQTRHTMMIGESSPASDTSVIMNLGEQNVRIDVIDEASSLFASARSNEGFKSNIANVYQMLYTSTGKYFGGKTAYKYKSNTNPEGRLGECNNPYVNLFCGLTIEDFKNCFSADLMDKGLGGRFLFFIDSEKKKRNKNLKTLDINPDIIKFVSSLYPSTQFKINDDSIKDILNLRCTAGVESKIIDALDYLDDLKFNETDESVMPIMNRLGQTFIKMLILDTVSEQYEKPLTKIKTKSDNIDWSLLFLDKYVKNMKVFINLNMSNSFDERCQQALKTIIMNAGKEGITLRELSRDYGLRKLMPRSDQKKNHIKSLLETEEIFQKKCGKKTLFYSEKYILTV